MTGARAVGRRSKANLAGNLWLVFGAIVAGVAVGEWAPEVARKIGVIAELYIDLLRMVVLPFMVASVVFSMRKLLADDRSVALLPRLLLAFFAVFLLAAVAGLLAGVLAEPGRHLSSNATLAMGKLAGTRAFGSGSEAMTLFGNGATASSQSLGDLLRILLPSNIFAALTQGESLKVLAFSLLFGLANGKAPGRVAVSLTEAMETVYEACLILTRWFNHGLPLVLFAIIASQTANIGLQPLRAMVRFLLALSLGALLVVVLSLWVLRIVSGRSWPEVLRSQRQPLLMAIATRSSHACMPAMIASLVESLGFARVRIELLVPLGISLLRAGPALYYAVATVFVAQLYNVHLGAAQLGIVVAGSILAGIASSGMSGLITLSLTAVVCNYLKLPFEAAFALFAVVDPLCDMARTVVLVAGNSAFAALAAAVPVAVED